MRNNIKRRKQSLSLSLTPMIDVMTVLLAVFMITAPMMQSGINLDLPEGSKSSITGTDNSINISVDRNGKYYFSDIEMNKEDIIKKSIAMFKENPNLSIMISGDTKTDYGAVMSIMTGLKDAGFQKVGLKTKLVK